MLLRPWGGHGALQNTHLPTHRHAPGRPGTGTIRYGGGPSSSAGRTIKILTLNIQANATARGTPRGVRALEDLIAGTDADVVALQEVLWGNHNAEPILVPRGYRLVARCEAEDVPKNSHWAKNGDEDGVLCNTILAKEGLADRVEALPSLNVTQFDRAEPDPWFMVKTCNCPTRRCAVSVRIRFGGGVAPLTLSNVHLCGGTLDDMRYMLYADIKRRQIGAVVDGVPRPDVIVGDFNGERDLAVARRTVDKYRPYATAKKADESAFFTRRFLDFYRGAHTELEARGYVPLYTEASLGSHTSAHGGTPDWVYARGALARPDRLIGVRVVPALHLTDHNGVLVELALE